jgi:ribosomal-protein-alanine N-acetyltransferase
MAEPSRDSGPIAEAAPASVTLRDLRPEDVSAVAAIERSIFSNPWSEQAFREFLRSGPTFAQVAVAGAEIAGYALGWCAAGVAELANLAVAAQWQGRSVGSRLLHWVLETCSGAGASEITLEVRASNLAAQRLYERHGFVLVGRRRGYYMRPREDALIYRAELTSPLDAAACD